jgi:nucleoside diphosphate kinase
MHSSLIYFVLQELMNAFARAMAGLAPKPEKSRPPSASVLRSARPKAELLFHPSPEESEDEEEEEEEKEEKKEAEAVHWGGSVTDAERSAVLAAARQRSEKAASDLDVRRQAAIERHRRDTKERHLGVRSEAETFKLQAEAWAAVIDAAAPGRGLFHPNVSFTPPIAPLPCGLDFAPAPPALFTIVMHLQPSALPMVCEWVLSQSLADRPVATPEAMPPFRVFGLALTRAEAEAEEDSVVLSAVAAAETPNGSATSGSAAVLVMSHAVERGALPKEVHAATGGGRVSFEVGADAPVWQSPSMVARAPVEGNIDAAAETTTTLLQVGAVGGRAGSTPGEGGADAAVGQALGLVLSRAAEKGLNVAGLRMLWLTKEQAGSLIAHTPLRPCSQGGAVLALALRGKDAISRWRGIVGPKDPLVARVTDPTSLKALMATDNKHALSCADPQSAQRELALLFGGRLAKDTFPPRTWRQTAGTVLFVAPLASQRAWIVCHPLLPPLALAALFELLGESGLNLFQVGIPHRPHV